MDDPVAWAAQWFDATPLDQCPEILTITANTFYTFTTVALNCYQFLTWLNRNAPLINRFRELKWTAREGVNKVEQQRQRRWWLRNLVSVSRVS